MQSIPITKQTDQDLLDAFQKLFESFHEVIESSTAYTIAGPSFSNPFSNDSVKNVLEFRSTLINRIHIKIPDFDINYYRGGSRQEKSPFIDEIQIGVQSYSSNRPECPLSDLQKLEVVAFIANQFEAINPKRAIKGALSEEQHELLALHQETLSRLESLNENLIEKSHKFRQDIEDEYVRKKEEYKKKTQRELDEKLAEVQEEKEILKSKLKDIDDRDNTHVRRQLRNNILDEIKKRSNEFKLTKGTNQLRLPIHISCIFVTLIFGLAAWLYGKEVLLFTGNQNFNTTAFAILTAKQFAFTLASGGTAIFYIKWLNKWFEQHSTAEFNIKQFQLDIERSSWVVETVLEWNEKKENPIPAELLTQLTKGLFSYENIKPEPIQHPADHLASAILGTASNVKLKAGNAQLEFSGKQLKKNMAENKNTT
jgi:hypothetical protein